MRIRLLVLLVCSAPAGFNAETAGSTVFGPPVPQTGLPVSAISASFVMGVSL